MSPTPPHPAGRATRVAVRSATGQARGVVRGVTTLAPRVDFRGAMALPVLLLGAVLTVVAAGPPASGGQASGASGASYASPLDGMPDVARRFERPAQKWAAGHRGVDLRAAEGVVVRAPGAGVVTFAGSVAGRGVVTVAHPDGRRSSLEPVSASVAVGTAVVLGQPVGSLQPSGSHCAPAVCLHWGVRVGAEYEDPWGLLPGSGPVVLLSSGPGAHGADRDPLRSPPW